MTQMILNMFTSSGDRIFQFTTLQVFRTRPPAWWPILVRWRSIIFLLEGGSGYFRLHAVQPHLTSGKLHLVPGAPHFSFPIYAAHSANVDAATLGAALTVLRAVATAVREVATAEGE